MSNFAQSIQRNISTFSPGNLKKIPEGFRKPILIWARLHKKAYEYLCPASAMKWFIKGSAMCYHVNMM